MISCLLIQISRNQKGLPASNEIRFAGESIELGRGAACQIHLPDHRVGLLHATLRRDDDGSLRIEAAENALISINGFLESSAVMVPGMQIGIGPYLLTVRPASGDTDLTLALDMQKSNAETSKHRGAPVNLAALTISKRGIGFGLAALILIGLFILPLLARISPAFESWQATLPMALTQSLNPGPLAPGHTVFGMKCSSCHTQAFQAVSDQACTECHRQVADHLVNAGPHAEAFNGTRCTDCHPAHQGKAQATHGSSAPCLSCHSDSAKTVAEVRDFGTRHPQFHLTIPAGKEVVRALHDGRPLPPEQSGLKYSHQYHLDKEGIKSPLGNTVLTCNDCHRLDAAGEHFEPIDMEKSCQQSRCHKLRLGDPVSGVLKHGSERDALQRMRLFFARDLAGAPREVATRCPSLPRTGIPAELMLDCADELAKKHAGATLFNTESKQPECALCHEIITTGDAEMPWKIARVRSRHDWQKAGFNHARHGTMACSDCHDKQDSKLAEDISMPRIEKCQECHVGSAGASNKIRSECESCHRFHRVPQQPSS